MCWSTNSKMVASRAGMMAAGGAHDGRSLPRVSQHRENNYIISMAESNEFLTISTADNSD